MARLEISAIPAPSSGTDIPNTPHAGKQNPDYHRLVTNPQPPRPDRTRFAQVGLALIAASIFLGNVPIVGLLPATISFLLPRFKVLGWWLTVVLVMLFLCVTVGGAVYLTRNWNVSMFESAYLTRLTAALMAVMIIGCLLALFGLLSPGTRRAVDRRTLEQYPHAFDEPSRGQVEKSPAQSPPDRT